MSQYGVSAAELSRRLEITEGGVSRLLSGANIASLHTANMISRMTGNLVTPAMWEQEEKGGRR